VIFGQEQFYPITDYLDRLQYNKLLKSCSIAIMNHNKQHAMGNVITLLYLGSKLFLNSQNPVYLYLKTEGFIVYEMKMLSQYHLDNKLNFEEININRKLIMNLYSNDVVSFHTSELLRKIKPRFAD
jgi:hypothetical protein